MASVCVGNEFSVNAQGQLKIELAGDGPDIAYPAGAVNYLRRDPNLGLYVLPTYVTRIRADSGLKVLEVLMANGDCRQDELNVQITNVSPVRPSFAHLSVTHWTQCRLDPGAGVLLRVGAQVNASPTTYVNSRSFHNPTATVRQYYEQVTQDLVVPLTPGEFASLRVQLSVCANGGAGQNVRLADVRHVADGIMVSA